jgi:hypothetical protein
MTEDRFILCMKWGPSFPADYVNVLFHACQRHMRGPYRFVCLADRPDGLAPGIEVLPIPDIGLNPAQWFTKGVWPKIALFSADLHGLRGRALFIDLDMMVTGSLDEMFTVPGEIITLDVGENWRPGASGHPPEPGTGVIAFDIGQQHQICEAFMANRDQIIATVANEQTFVGMHARGLQFWPIDWVPSFKRHVARRLCGDLLREPDPPVSARILAFHGTPRPIDLLSSGLWGRFPHLGRGPVSWVRQYWLDNGGHIPPR